MKRPFYAKLAAILPRKLVYYAVIRLWGYATTGKYGNTEVPAITIDEAVRRFRKDFEL